MKSAKWMLAFLLVFSLLGTMALGQDREKELEDAIKKLDDYYKKLRRELEAKLRRARGEKKPVPARGGKAFVGLSLSPLSKGVRVLLNLGEGEGIVVKRVVEGGPSDKAGIRAYDIILKFGGRKVGSMDDMREVLGGLSAGQEVKIVILRDGKRLRRTMVVGGKGGAAPTPGPRTGPSRTEDEVSKFLGETYGARRRMLARHLKDLMGRNMERRMRARRFFEKLAAQSKEKRRQILKEVESVVEDMLGGLTAEEKTQLRKVFRELMGGLKQVFKGQRSQKKADIEAYLDALLGKGKTSPGKGKKDDIDELIEDLLGDKGKKGKKDKTEKKAGSEEIPKEWEKLIKAFMGEEGWKRIKEMLKDPNMREMVKNFLPKNFKFTPEAIRKLMEQYGVSEEDLPDRLRDMGLDEDSIKRILKKLKEDKKKAGPKKGGKPWLGIRASQVDAEQQERLGIKGGMVVTHVSMDGPADKAGVMDNDIILKANGKKVSSTADFKTVLKPLGVGDVLTLLILRDGYKKVVKVKLTTK